ncbi:hypothetical protein IGI96_003716 [Enterococcus sp. DIV0421]|uniref:PepSY domain-containing protein n=1 Tax=Enterococcus sp. DIV0421 TaxID=2774688 RepID=UPI003F2750EA
MVNKKVCLVFAILIFLFTGCTVNNGNDVGSNNAKMIAFSDAGVTENDVTRLYVNRSEDDGRVVYEVDFTVFSTGVEYDYEISAVDGSILEVNKEVSEGVMDTKLYQNQSAVEVSQNQDKSKIEVSQDKKQNQSKMNEPKISEDKAVQFVLGKVPGSTVQNIRIKLDLDDGIQKYEGNLIFDGREYDFEIDANTGTFIEWQKEWID